MPSDISQTTRRLPNSPPDIPLPNTLVLRAPQSPYERVRRETMITTCIRNILQHTRNALPNNTASPAGGLE